MTTDTRPLTLDGFSSWCRAFYSGRSCRGPEDEVRLIREMASRLPPPQKPSPCPADAPAIPPDTLAGMQGYVKRGEHPGGFLCSVFANDLVDALARADKQNRLAIEAIANWAWSNAPKPAFGSYEKVGAWVRRGDDWRAKEAERQEEAITDVETKAP